MKPLLSIAAIAVAIIHSVATANPIPCGGRIAAYGDVAGVHCDIYDVTPAVITVRLLRTARTTSPE